MKISVVIPNFNGEQVLKKNLEKVLSVLPTQEIIVVDDASTDESVAMLRRLYPKVKVICRRHNNGFASTANDGVLSSTNDLVLLLNHDVYPEEGVIDYLIPHFQDQRVFAVGCLQKCREIGSFISRGRGVGRFKHGFLVHNRGEVDKTDTLWVSGGAGMFRKEIWMKLGGLDILYNPFYWEDIDLSYRALKDGYKVLFEPKSTVNHIQNEGVIRQKFLSTDIKTISYRNQIFFVWLNISDSYLLIQHFIFLPYHFIRAVFQRDWPFIKGFFMAFFHLPQVLVHRFRNKKLRVREDYEILRTYSE